MESITEKADTYRRPTAPALPPRTGSLRRLILLSALLLISSVLGCFPQRPPVPVGEVPKPQPLTVSEEQYGHQVLAALTERFPLDYDHPRHHSVVTVVDKLTAAAKADADPWHLYVFKDNSVKNAAATRGNHVFIWTGMIDATQDDEELAAVLAHEIGHILARHTDPDPNEEVRKLLINLGALAVGIAATHAVGSSGAQIAGELAQGLTNEVGSGLLLYPYSRDRELEADQIGLFMMADAGYNPEAAVRFWERAQGDPSFGAGLEFFSTHPPAEARLARLKTLLPQALLRYRGEAPRETLLTRLQPSANAERPQITPRSRGTGSDSFDISGLLQAETRPWRVRGQRAVVFAEADTGSKQLGEYRKDAIVYVTRENGDWLRVEQPDSGWVQREQLEPELR